MNTKRLFTILMSLMFILMVSCQKENNMTGPEPDMPTFWTAVDVQKYLADYNYPANALDYEIQFYKGKNGIQHRSQLSAEDLAEVIAIEDHTKSEIRKGREYRMQKRAAEYSQLKQNDENSLAKVTLAGGADYYFYVPYQSPGDWEDFDMANMVWGNMIYPYTTSPWVWDSNTDYMVDNSDVVECRNFLVTYATTSTITGLISSNSSSGSAGGNLPPGIEPIPLGGGGGMMMAKTTGVNGIESVPGGYVFSDLNPSFESWTAGGPVIPVAWNIPISSPYNMPSNWNDYYDDSDVLQSTNSSAGTYATGLDLSRNVGKVLASGYFEIPYDKQETGDWYATIDFAGNPQSVILTYEFGLYDNSDNLIDTGSGTLSPGSSYGYGLNTIQMTATVLPKYVRFAIIQEVGQNRNTVYVDNVTLSGPMGDVSLPVTLTSFTGFPWGWGGNLYFLGNWVTASELNNYRWWLYYKNASGAYVKASNTTVPGAGTTSGYTYYSYKSFQYNSAMVSYVTALPSGAQYEVILVDESINGVLNYNTDFPVIITK